MMAAELAGISERTDGPTPAGGTYAVAFFRDAAGAPCPKARAATVEVVEFAADGTPLARTYAEVRGPGPPGTID
jgi:hypothetical protein